MPKAFDTWTVLKHKPIAKLADNLWTVLGSLPKGPLKRVMALVRMADGRLLIHNAVALEEESMKEIESWGKPAFIVVPNGFHRLDALIYKNRYPDAQIVCPAGSRSRVEQVVPVDLTYEQFTGDDSVTIEHVRGTKDREGVLTVRSPDGVTLVFNDVLFNIPHQPGVGGVIFRIIGSTGGPKVTRIARMFLVNDKKALAEHLSELANKENLVRIIPGHGFRIDENAAETLRGVAATL